uniref:Venom S1 protease with CUB domain 4 n=1 Tax=Platymeris rhadamanthus TaxID=1134088 RepID=A0A6B9L3Z9_PLARH|nr:venom S1 protease with CUB domain 4 [Platymeris rhadamanthus]
MLTLLLFTLLFTALSSADETIQIKNGEVYTKLETPDYPQVYLGEKSLNWRFEAEKDTKLKIQCDDFRMTESEGCSAVRLEIDDGTNKSEYCGYQKTLKIVSASNWFTVKMDGSAQAVFSCFVKSMVTPEPEVVEVTLNKLHHLEIPEVETPFFDRLWHFKTAEGQQVEFKCYINLMQMDPCYEEVLTFDLGDGPQEYCGFQEKVLFSRSNEAKLRLELGTNGGGKLHCVVQAAIKKLPEPGTVESSIRSLGDDEDSSEHGGAPGKKGTTCNCGWANKPKARIIRGREASPNEYPWMVALKAYFGEAHINCGGSIVTNHHVLTAAHCLLNMYVDMSPVKPEDLFVIVGLHNLEKLTPKGTVKQYRAASHFIRPEFTTQYTHDFAIVIVKDKIEFTQTVGPICLSPKRIAEPKQKITIIGWGKTETGETSTVLLKAKTSVIDRKRCDINPHEICTRADQSATCAGDSGGPLSWLDPDTNRYTLMSVVSYGDPDCVSTPSVSTDIAFFYEWIQKIIKSTHPTDTTCTKQ